MDYNQWSHYWSNGQLTSLPQDFSQNYDGEIRDYWYLGFSNLSDNSKILDLCTGNGAIALLAQQYSDDYLKHFSISAIDAAEINITAISERFPNLNESLAKIEFIGQQVIEAMAFGEKFDLITSQYGIEYCNWELASTSIANHLVENGHLRIITHAPDTDITQYMSNEREEYQFLEKIGFFIEIDLVLQNKTKFAHFRKAIKSLSKSIKSKIRSTKSPLFESLIQFCQHIESSSFEQFETERVMLGKFYKDHHFAYQRLNDILNVSDRIKADPKWYQIFCDNGLELVAQHNILQRGRHLAGIGYVFKK